MATGTIKSENGGTTSIVPSSIFGRIYFTKRNGIVFFEAGDITGAVSGTWVNIGNIPDGFIPSSSMVYVGVTASAQPQAYKIQVTSTGLIRFIPYFTNSGAVNNQTLFSYPV